MPKPVHGISIDYDGCLCHSGYLSTPIARRDIVAANKEFLNFIKEQNKSYSKSIVFVGSNRQSKAVDDCNASAGGGRGSCFPAIKRIADELEVTFDPFLLADIYGNLKSGTSYSRAVGEKEVEKEWEHAKWMFDETKATILYAQMHKMACDNPEEEIVFDFYDDRKNILESLQGFYKKYPELIPLNVTLNLCKYRGSMSSEIKPSATIKGKGIIDRNYYETVKDMGKLANPKREPNYRDPFTISNFVTPDKLKNRISLIAIEKTLLQEPVDPTIGVCSDDSTTSTPAAGAGVGSSTGSSILSPSSTVNPYSHFQPGTKRSGDTLFVKPTTKRPTIGASGPTSETTPAVEERFLGEDLPHAVAEARLQKAAALLTAIPDKTQTLLQTPGSFTDYSGRTFNCTAYEYAYWAKDIRMCCMLESHMSDETRVLMLARINEIESSGLEYLQDGKTYRTKHYDLTPLKQAIQQYVDGCLEWDRDRSGVNVAAQTAAWLKIGKAQRDVPAHIAQEYCMKGRPFWPLPSFNVDREGILKKTLLMDLDFYNWITGRDEFWFPSKSASSYLGHDLSIIRGADIAFGEGHWFGEFGSKTNCDKILRDLEAINLLDQVRSEELAFSLAYLNFSAMAPGM